MTFNAALRTALLLTLLASAPAQAAAEDAILLIDQTAGVAGVQRDGKRLALQAGDALQEQDLIVTDRSGRMTLRLGRHGFVEVGPNAEVGVERLPFATYARDLKSIFSVSKGYFRVVWKHPQLSSSWPLYVYMAGHRISLGSGEYFFQNTGNVQQACVAAGQINLQAAGKDSVEAIKPPACVRLGGSGGSQVLPRNPDDWIAIRRGFSIEATATTLLPPEPATGEPPAAKPAKPVIKTQPTLIETPPPGSPIAGPGDEPVAPTQTPAPAPPRVAVAPAQPITTAPVIIGQVQTAPLNPPTRPLPPPVASAPVIARPPPAPPAAALPAGSGGWSLNVASYSDAAVAEREVQRLRAAGYRGATAQPAQVNGKTWYRVQLAGFGNEAEARSAAQALKTQMGLPNVWVLKP